MVKLAPLPVNAAARFDFSLLLREQALIWLLLGGLAYVVYAFGFDTKLAQAVYHPQSEWGWILRQHGTKPAVALAIGCFLALFWPGLWRKAPALYHTAVVVVLTTALGAGLLSQVIVQDLADRARPRESVLAPSDYSPPAEFRGNSMPSGHAAMAFVLAAPFFPLRRRHPRAAAAFLAAGVASGLLVGGARMVLGAHFASDVLVAGAVTLASASLFAALVPNKRPVPPMAVAGALVVAVLALLLGNNFTTDLTRVLDTPFKRIEIPCEIVAVPTPGVQQPTLHVLLKGYGAPLSQLRLYDDGEVVKIQTRRGLYHSLSCTARLETPAE